MQNNDVLLVIDPQNDFMDIQGAALGVPGAVEDMQRLAAFIDKVNPRAIFASQDSHYALDISHPSWWVDSQGNFVKPFTLIKADDIENGKYTARVDPKASLSYVKSLEANGEFLHFIWPEHCLIGTPGHAYHPVFFDAISEWSRKNLRWVNFITKGTHPFTEHFGIFRANVPNSDPTTQINQAIFNALNSYDNIYFAGEAWTHCVVNSLRQLLQLAPQLASKIIVLEDCSSPVPNAGPQDFYDMVDGIYNDAKSKGVRFEKSTAISGTKFTTV